MNTQQTSTMSMPTFFTPTAEAGFTLIELMISITLGLLITVAATQILITSQGGVRAQQAGSDIQMEGAFAINNLVSRIRMANFGAQSTDDQSAFVMNATTPLGGIVFTATNSSATPKVDSANILMDMSSAGIDIIKSKSGSHPSNINGLNSDQLTIQRRVESDMFSCEGEEIIADKEHPKQLVERYFIRKASSTASATDLVLACKAATYADLPAPATPPAGGGFAGGYATVELGKDDTVTPPKIYKNLGDGGKLKDILKNDGQIVIDNVDHFQYLLAIDTNKDSAVHPKKAKVGYVTANDYMKLKAPKPRIVAIKVAVLVHSETPVSSGIKNADQRFDILGENNKVLKNPSTLPNSQRQVYESTVFIRNARG